MDVIDDSQRWREAEEAETIRRARMTIGESLYQCEECFQVIPEARRRALPGVRLCVPCQEEKEGTR